MTIKQDCCPDLARPAQKIMEIQKVKTYSFVKRSGAFSFNTQEAIVFKSLQSVKCGTIDDLAKKAVELGLKTRQDPARIVAYYLVSLKKLGLVQSSGTSNRKVTIVLSDEDDEDIARIEDMRDSEALGE